jgi:hypothetical protein
VSLPQLDDRTYDDLIAEARALIPAFAPEWTDHNPSDPGIALLELFAWLAEMLIFRADQISDAQTLGFLRLLRRPDWQPEAGLDEEIAATLRELRDPWRAVTPADYARLVPQVAPGRIARVAVVPRRDLNVDPDADAPGRVSLVVLPHLNPVVELGSSSAAQPVTPPFELALDAGQSLWVGADSPFAGIRVGLEQGGDGYALRTSYYDGRQFRAFNPDDGTQGMTQDGTIEDFPPAERWGRDDKNRCWIRIASDAPATAARVSRVEPVMPQPDRKLADDVLEFLEPRRILTTIPVVTGARFVPVGVDAVVACRPGIDPAALRAQIVERLVALLGDDWPLGRSVYVTELQRAIDELPGVDYVPDVLATGPDAQLLVHPNGDPVGVTIGANQLPDPRIDPDRIVIGAKFVSVTAQVTVTPAADVSPASLAAALKRRVRAFYSPLGDGPRPGGPAREWPVAKLKDALARLDGVHDLSVTLTTLPKDRMTGVGVGVPVLSLRDDELVDVTTEVVTA